MSLDPKFDVGVKNNAVFIIMEESITFGNRGMNSLEIAAIAAGVLTILAAVDISGTISVALPSASALADASGLTVAASDAGAAAGSVSLSIGFFYLRSAEINEAWSQRSLRGFYKCKDEIGEMFQKRYSLYVHNFRDDMNVIELFS
jgi:hypothetical protein